MESTTIPTVDEAMRAIAARCDGAISEDGIGFSGQDTKFGKRYAGTHPDHITDDMRRDAWEILRKYRKQLLSEGINYDDIPEPPIPEGYSKWNSREQAREIERETVRQVRRKTESIIDFDGGLFVVKFPYSAALVSAVKTIPGRKWDPVAKTWTIPQVRWEGVIEFAQQYEFRFTDTATEAIEGLREISAVDPDALLEDQIFVEDGKFVYQDDFVRERTDFIRTMTGRSWDAAKKVWRVPFANAERIAEMIVTFDLRVSDEARAIIDKAVKEAKELREASSAEEADLDIPGLVGDLYPFQKAGVSYLLRSRRAFLADEMGTGKTIQAIAALEAANAYPAVIAVPPVVVSNWVREIKKWVPHRKVATLSGRNPGYPGQADIFVIGYSVLANWSEDLAALRPLASVFDECHFLKTGKSQRTKGAKLVAKYTGTNDDDAMILMLSGTPLVNRPEELVPQLQIMRRLEDFGGWQGYKYAYINSTDPGRFLALNDRLRATCMVRRLKEDVLKELPERTFSDLYLDASEPAMREYYKAEADVIRYLAEEARKKAADLGDDPSTAAVIAAMKARSAEHLVRINLLRQLAAKAKIPAGIEWVKNFLDSSDEKIVVLAHHKPILAAFADAFDAEVISGDNKGDKVRGGEVIESERQEIVDRFQEGSKRVIVVGITAGGMGITLHAASNAYVHEYPWAPAHLRQGVDRLHRIGQRFPVTAWLGHLQRTIDDDMSELLVEKAMVVDPILDGGEAAEETESGSVASDLFERFARRAMEGDEENAEGEAEIMFEPEGVTE